MKKSLYLQVFCCGSLFSEVTLAESLSMLWHPTLKKEQNKNISLYHNCFNTLDCREYTKKLKQEEGLGTYYVSNFRECFVISNEAALCLPQQTCSSLWGSFSGLPITTMRYWIFGPWKKQPMVALRLVKTDVLSAKIMQLSALFVPLKWQKKEGGRGKERERGRWAGLLHLLKPEGKRSGNAWCKYSCRWCISKAKPPSLQKERILYEKCSLP